MTAAAPRDASWYNHPDVTTFKVVHAATGDNMAVCDRHVFLVDTPRWLDATEVPEHIRCRRPACVKAYREAIQNAN